MKEFKNPKPTAVICRTIKGKGVSFMEDDNYGIIDPDRQEYINAIKELGLKKRNACRRNNKSQKKIKILILLTLVINFMIILN